MLAFSKREGYDRGSSLQRSGEVLIAKILVVEDEPHLRNLIRNVVRHAGHEVSAVANAKAALDLCDSGSCFDLVLCEVDLPTVDGHELARAIAFRCARSRVMLMSDLQDFCGDCPYAAGCAFVRKSFVSRELVAAIDSTLEQPAIRACLLERVLLEETRKTLGIFHKSQRYFLEGLKAPKVEYEAARRTEEAAFFALIGAWRDYRDHVSEHRCRSNLEEGDPLRQIEILDIQLEGAHALFESACDKLRRLADLAAGDPSSTTIASLEEQAKRAHRAAYRVYQLTLQRLKDFGRRHSGDIRGSDGLS